jgi:hypothetical protein
MSPVYTGMALDPNNTSTGVANYLLRVGPMPPPTPQDLALASVFTELSKKGPLSTHGMRIFLFGPQAKPLENPGPLQGPMPPILFGRFDKYLPPHYRCSGASPRPSRRLDVHLPERCGNQGKDDPLVVTILTFDTAVVTTSLSKTFLSQQRSCFWAGGI